MIFTSNFTTRLPAAFFPRAGLFAAALALPVALASAALAHDAAAPAHDSQAHDSSHNVTTASGLTIEEPWSRATAKGARVGGGYLVLVNKGEKDDVLLSGSSDIAEKTEIHEMAVVDDVMRMRKLDDGLAVKAGETVALKPGGYHVMFIGLKHPLKEGDTFTTDFVFRNAGTVPVTFAVRALGARDAGHDHGDKRDHQGAGGH